MFAFDVSDLVFLYSVKRLAGKNISEMTILCWVGSETLSQSSSNFRM